MIWFREQYKQGVIYLAKFRATRKIAAIMESIAVGGSYQWQAQAPWYIAEIPAPYQILIENYAQHRRNNGYRETVIASDKM